MFIFKNRILNRILVIILVFNIFNINVSATEIKIRKLDASSPFKSITDRITQTFLDKDNNIYTLDWTGNKESNNIGNYIIKWDNAKRSISKLKTPKNIKKQIISSVSTIYKNEIMPNGNILLSWSEWKDADENGIYDMPYYVAVISPNGKLISKIKINDIFKITEENVDNKFYYVYPYKENRLVVVCTINDFIRYDDNIFIGVIDYKTKKIIWQRHMKEEEGWDRDSQIIDNKYIIGYNNDITSLNISDIRSGNIIQKITIENYDVEAFEYKNGYLYIATDDGIYKVKMKGKNIQKVISIPKSNWLRKNSKTLIEDITVVNDNEIYICGCKHNWEGECRLYWLKK